MACGLHRAHYTVYPANPQGCVRPSLGLHAERLRGIIRLGLARGRAAHHRVEEGRVLKLGHVPATTGDTRGAQAGRPALYLLPNDLKA